MQRSARGVISRVVLERTQPYVLSLFPSPRRSRRGLFLVVGKRGGPLPFRFRSVGMKEGTSTFLHAPGKCPSLGDDLQHPSVRRRLPIEVASRRLAEAVPWGDSQNRPLRPYCRQPSVTTRSMRPALSLAIEANMVIVGAVEIFLSGAVASERTISTRSEARPSEIVTWLFEHGRPKPAFAVTRVLSISRVPCRSTLKPPQPFLLLNAASGRGSPHAPPGRWCGDRKPSRRRIIIGPCLSCCAKPSLSASGDLHALSARGMQIATFLWHRACAVLANRHIPSVGWVPLGGPQSCRR